MAARQLKKKDVAPTEERISKILSAHGVCSRRAAEELLRAGRVTVDGVVAEVGQKADPQADTICVDGKALAAAPRDCYIMLHKPRGYVTTLSDEKGRKTAAELVWDCGYRVWPVGRLDLNSEGLLLFTNDGEGTHRLLHPSHEVDKEYLVWVTGNVNKALPILSAPMTLDGEPLAPARVCRGRDSGGVHQLSVTIHQGKNRQVRRMCAQAGLEVLRLKRIREGALSLDRTLKAGHWRALTGEERLALTELVRGT